MLKGRAHNLLAAHKLKTATFLWLFYSVFLARLAALA